MILEFVGRAAQVLVALAGAYLVVLWFALIVWTFRDIEGRSRSVFTQVFSTLLSVLFFVPGVLLYMLLRPKETLDEAFQRSLEEEYLLQDLEELPHCPSCHRFVEDDFVLCPHCHAQLREPCGNCERLLDLRWPLCPYCGVVQSEQAESGDRVEPPAARWTAPGLRRRRVGEGVSRPARLPFEDEPREVVAAVSRSEAEPLLERTDTDTSSLAASLASGVRSIVRPFDRFLGRGDAESSDDGRAESAAPRFGPPYETDAQTTTSYDSFRNGTSNFEPELHQPEPVIVARHRFATNGQPGRHERQGPTGDGYGNGTSPNGAEPIVPFPSEPERASRNGDSTAVPWPPPDRDHDS